MSKKRKHVKKKRHVVPPLVTTAIVLSLLSAGTIYGSKIIMELRADDAALRTYASGIVQKERFSRNYKDESIDFDKKYTTDSSNLMTGYYTDGKHLKEQLISLEVRCCLIGGRYYSLDGESIMIYSHYVSDEVTREGIIYPDEMNRFIIPKGISLDDCEMLTTIPYEDMNEDLVLSAREYNDTMAMTLKK